MTFDVTIIAMDQLMPIYTPEHANTAGMGPTMRTGPVATVQPGALSVPTQAFAVLVTPVSS